MTGVSNKSQLSIFFRYATSKGKVEDRFLEFSDVSSQRKAAWLFLILFEYIGQFQCSEELVTQICNEAPMMSGSISELQTLVKEKYPESAVLFFLCFAYRLNLFVENAVESVKDCKIFLKRYQDFLYLSWNLTTELMLLIVKSKSIFRQYIKSNGIIKAG